MKTAMSLIGRLTGRLQYFVMPKIVPDEYLLYGRKLILNGGKFRLRE